MIKFLSFLCLFLSMNLFSQSINNLIPISWNQDKLAQCRRLGQTITDGIQDIFGPEEDEGMCAGSARKSSDSNQCGAANPVGFNEPISLFSADGKISNNLSDIVIIRFELK